jgi:uncharacterized repeat protein (TIGR03803 family)
LFGTTQGGGDSVGTVFEISYSDGGYATVPSGLTSFDLSNGSNPVASLIVDANGDLFGTTEYGDSGDYGTVFEIVKTADGYDTTPTTLIAFDGADGAEPVAGLFADAAGNLFGTTQYYGTVDGGAPTGYGSIFEIAKTADGYATTPTTLISFDNTDGAMPFSGVIADAEGNLFGTTYFGGANGDGTVFEIAKTADGYANTPTTLVNFDGSDGANPQGGLLIDAAGNLFGTTVTGGADMYGTVFKIAKIDGNYASTPTTLASFDSTNGQNPVAGLIANGAGDLFGTTEAGGTSEDGTVFEITDSGFVLACFLPGTWIATPTGERAIETLAAGDLVLTATGEALPVVWLGHSRVQRRVADPLTVLPIRIRAGAISSAVPSRDLLVSPGHAILVDGVLVHAVALVNGRSIVREWAAPAVFTYWHLELDAHAVLLAEGTPAESFLASEAEFGFDNWAERRAPEPAEELAYPRCKAARQVPRATRERLAARAAMLCPADDAVLAAA